MNYRIEVVLSSRKIKQYKEQDVEKIIMEEAKRIISTQLASNIVFSKNEGNFHTTNFANLYVLTQEQVDYIESMLSLAPTIKGGIMDEILNK